DAFGEIDVVARRAPRAVGALLGLDRDGERRADGFAELARDAALLAVRIAAQRVQPAEAGAERRLLLRKLHGDLAREQMPPGQHQALHELEEQPRIEEALDPLDHRRILLGPSGTGPPTASAS